MASASIFAIGLTISTIVFTSIIIILVKAKKTARRTVLATQSRARLSRHEEQNPVSQQPRRITATSESRANTTIYDDDMDYEMAKMAVMATNKNIAYEGVYAKEHVYAQIH